MAAQNDLKQYLNIDDLRAAIVGLKEDNKEFGKSAEAIFKILREQTGLYRKEIEAVRDALRNTSTTNPNSGETLNGLSKRVNELITAFNQAKDSGTGLNNVLNTQKDAIAQLQKEQKAYEQAIKQVKNAENQESEQVKQLEAQYKALSSQINGLSQELKTAKRATDIISGTYTSLSKELAANREQLRNMANAFDLNTGKINKNNAAAVQLNKTIQSQDKALKQMDASMGNFQRNVGNYSSVIDLLQGNFISLSRNIGVVAVAIVALQQVIGAGQYIIDVATKVERFDIAVKNTSGGFDEYQRNLKFIEVTANSLGLDIFALGEGFKLLAGATEETALQGEYTRKIFLGVSQAAAAMQLNSEDTLGAIRALGQMMSKGTVQAEELRGQLAERIPGAFRRAAESIGVTTEKLSDMLKAGDVVALELLPKLAKEFTDTFSAEANKNIESIAGSTAYLKNETSLLVAEFSKSSGINSFFSSITKGLGDVLQSLRTVVKSEAFSAFFSALTAENGGLGAAFDAYKGAVKGQLTQDSLDAQVMKFRGSDPKKRQQQLANVQNIVSKREKEASVVTQNNTIGVDALNDAEKKLIESYLFAKKLQKELLEADKQLLAEEAKLQKELAAKKAANNREQAEKDAKEAEKRRNKAISDLEKEYREKLQLQRTTQANEKADQEVFFAEGTISEKEYIQQINQIEVNGANARQKILSDYNEKFLKLGIDKTDDAISTETDILNAKARLLTAGLKLEEEAYKETISNIRNFADVLGAEVKNQLQDKFGVADQRYNESTSNAELAFAKSKGTGADKKIFQDNLNEARIQQIQEYIAAIKSAESQILQIYSNSEEAEIQALYAKVAEEKKLGISKTDFEKEQADIVAKYKEKVLNESASAKKAILEKERELQRQLTQEEIRELEQKHEIEKRLNETKYEILTTSVSGFFEIQQANFQREREQLQASKDYEIQLAGDNDEAKKRIEKEYEKRQRDLRIKEAKAQKAESLFSIGINTARAIVATLAETPPPAGIPLAIAMGVLGAVQAAVVLSKPLPQYAKGKNKGDSYEGFALVGEAGAELVERNGQMQYFDKPTITYTDPNTKVYTANETRRILANQDSDTNRILRNVRANNESSEKLHAYKVMQQAQRIDYNQFMRLFKQQGSELKTSIEQIVSTHTLPDGSQLRQSRNSKILDITNTKYQ